MYHPTLGVDTSTMTPAQKAAYDKSMSEMQSRAGAAAQQSVAAGRSERYASLRPIAYPPPVAPIVQQAIDLSAAATSYAQQAAAATSAANAAALAQQATTAATRVVQKLAGAPKDPRGAPAIQAASQAVSAAASAVSKWTKEPPAQVQARLGQVAVQQAAQAAVDESDAFASTWKDLSAAWSLVKLDWRFWTGFGAAIYGTWLRSKR